MLKGDQAGISRARSGRTNGLIKKSRTADGLNAQLTVPVFIENAGVKIDG
jgi:hypothetical protein